MARNSNRSWFNWRPRLHLQQVVEEDRGTGSDDSGTKPSKNRRLESDIEAKRLVMKIVNTVPTPCPEEAASVAANILRNLKIN